jgi:ribonucleotide reductase beta subunit family protein with ferritin-like domain
MLGWFTRSATKPKEEVRHVSDELLIFDTITPADQPFVDLFKQQTASFWSSEELKFMLDATDLEKLSPKAKKLFEYILAFFATADGEVLENAVVNFLTESESLPIRMAYSAQVFFESIHISTYASAMTVYIPDSTRRTELTMAFKTDPLIKERDDWMNHYISPCSQASDKLAAERHKARRLVAFACAEGLFFMSAFMVIAWLRSCDLFPIFARANELISRDEWFHVKLGIARFKRVYGSRLTEIGMCEEDIVIIVREAVELECKFATSLVPASSEEDRFDGLRAEDLVLHIQNLGNEIIRMIGITTPELKRPWDVDAAKLPPWVSWIQVQPKASFYETAVTSYTTPTAVSDDPNRDLDF